ncbi:hypothetical protein N9Y17_04070 [Gammaproteobacteria bacterium]|nr:hypothetical protein [Gammaproteobacteria bacterium]
MTEKLFLNTCSQPWQVGLLSPTKKCFQFWHSDLASKGLISFFHQTLTHHDILIENIRHIFCLHGHGSRTGVRLSESFCHGFSIPFHAEIISIDDMLLVALNVFIKSGDQRITVLGCNDDDSFQLKKYIIKDTTSIIDDTWTIQKSDLPGLKKSDRLYIPSNIYNNISKLTKVKIIPVNVCFYSVSQFFLDESNIANWRRC